MSQHGQRYAMASGGSGTASRTNGYPFPMIALFANAIRAVKRLIFARPLILPGDGMSSVLYRPIRVADEIHKNT